MGRCINHAKMLRGYAMLSNGRCAATFFQIAAVVFDCPMGLSRASRRLRHHPCSALANDNRLRQRDRRPAKGGRMRTRKEPYSPGCYQDCYRRESGNRKIKALKRLAAERERKMLETTSLGKLIK